MATITAINSRGKQSAGGLGGTVEYAEKDEKTVWKGDKLVGSLNCNAATAAREFMDTKRLFDKTDGKMYYHFVLSFPPDEKITPKECHAFAMEFAQHWKGFEVVAATHCDREHIHTHFIVNSVSFEDGRKYHCDSNEYRSLQQLNDAMCQKCGYSVCQKRAPEERVGAMKQSEYHTALRGDSWKMELRIAIDEAMKYASSREHLLEILRSEGYGVRWEDGRQSITYTHPNGMRCRDTRLGEFKYRKGSMENEFGIRKAYVIGAAQGAVQGERSGGNGGVGGARSDGNELGRAEQQREAARGSDDGSRFEMQFAYDGGGSERASHVAGGSHAAESGGNGGGDRGTAGKVSEDSERSERSAQANDGGINPSDPVTGWEREREFYFRMLQSSERTEKVANKIHMDQRRHLHCRRTPVHAVDHFVTALCSRPVPPERHRRHYDGDEDDIDKRLRYEIRCIKNGMNPEP